MVINVNFDVPVQSFGRGNREVVLIGRISSFRLIIINMIENDRSGSPLIIPSHRAFALVAILFDREEAILSN